MSLILENTKVPLRFEGESLRVGATRVSLDSVVYSFLEGATAEEIVEQYPALELSEVYCVLGYYLMHREELDQYLLVRRQAGEQARAAYEQAHPLVLTRERLLARRRSAQR